MDGRNLVNGDYTRRPISRCRHLQASAVRVKTITKTKMFDTPEMRKFERRVLSPVLSTTRRTLAKSRSARLPYYFGVPLAWCFSHPSWGPTPPVGFRRLCRLKATKKYTRRTRGVDGTESQRHYYTLFR